jgi:hypothetical protein
MRLVDFRKAGLAVLKINASSEESVGH